MNNLDTDRIVASAIVEILGSNYCVRERTTNSSYANGSGVDAIYVENTSHNPRCRGFLILINSQRMLICRHFISLADPNSLKTIASVIEYCLNRNVGCGGCLEYSTIFK